MKKTPEDNKNKRSFAVGGGGREAKRDL